MRHKRLAFRVKALAGEIKSFIDFSWLACLLLYQSKSLLKELEPWVGSCLNLFGIGRVTSGLFFFK